MIATSIFRIIQLDPRRGRPKCFGRLVVSMADNAVGIIVVLRDDDGAVEAATPTPN
jgi:hypothetical protein